MGALTEREGREQGKQLESEHTWETMRLYHENGLGRANSKCLRTYFYYKKYISNASTTYKQVFF